MFDIHSFVADCRAALAERSSEAVRDVVCRAIAEPDAILKVLGETERRQRRRYLDDPECRLGRSPMDLATQPQSPRHHRHVWRR